MAYFVLLLVMAFFGLYAAALTSLTESMPAAAISAASFVIDAICIVGLYGYIRSQAFARPAFWRGMLTVLIAKLLVSASFLVPNLFPIDGTLEHYVALAGLGGLVLALPLVVALWLYALRSPHLWVRSSAP